jgi:hypothetical protein
MAIAIAAPAFAEEDSGSLARRAPILESITDAAKEPAPKIEEFLAGQVPGQLLATDLIGLEVHGSGPGEAFGAIDDVLFDKSGKLSVVVVNVGKYLGAEKRVAFALEDLRYTMGADDIRLLASIDKPTLEAAPAFTSLADEMAKGDAQSLTAEESDPSKVEQPAAVH